MVGILVDQGKVEWTTQLQQVFPEFQRNDGATNITVADLLSHRTGLPSYDALWLVSDNQMPLGRSDAIKLLNYVPAFAPVRTEFLYNNMAYEALGAVIEKRSGNSYASFLHKHILEPLGLSQTFYTDIPLDDANLALPYIALANATPYQIPQPIHGKDVLIGPAGGIRSTVGDLLMFYKALIDAARAEVELTTTVGSRGPLRGLKHLWRGMISVWTSTLREYSYAAGWFRAELPAPPPLVWGDGPGMDPMIGHGLQSRLGLFHGGNIAGFTSWTAVFPETSSAVVVLSNSLPLADCVRLVGQLLIEELFGNTINASHYLEFAKSAAEQSASHMSHIKDDLLEHKTVDSPAYPLQAYVGKYYNAPGNCFVDIREVERDGERQLRVYFMGSSSSQRANTTEKRHDEDRDGFDLEPYQHNSFFWWMSHDELAQRARYTNWPKEYYIIEFDLSDREQGCVCSDAEPHIKCLRWKHEFSLPGPGELFRRIDSPGRKEWSWLRKESWQNQLFNWII